MNKGPTSPPVIAFRADDAGLNTAANAGIEECIRAGLVKNVSLMTIPPGFADAAAMLSRYPQVKVGLHVTLTCEWADLRWKPLLPRERVSSLVDASGDLHPDTSAILEKVPDEREFMNEVAAQLTLARSTGLEIRYLDEHMAVGLCLGFQDAIRKFAESEGLIYADDLPIARGLSDEHVAPQDFIKRLAGLEDRAAIMITHPSRIPEDGWRHVLRHKPGSDSSDQRNSERILMTSPHLLEAHDAGLFRAASIVDVHRRQAASSGMTGSGDSQAFIFSQSNP